MFFVGTPIGNLKDITLRALEILSGVDIILAEDKRRTVILLNHYGIKKELISFNSKNWRKKARFVVDRLKQGKKIALVTDSGMPGVSDPGGELARICWKEGIEMDVIPGPSALTSVVAVSGLIHSSFLFLGFIPRGKKRRKLFRGIKDSTHPIVFFESPTRIIETFRDMLNIFGDVDVFVAREMTKVNQEFMKGKLSEILRELESREKILGEFTIVVGTIS